MSATSLADLPDELLKIIGDSLHLAPLVSMRLTCRKLNRLFAEPVEQAKENRMISRMASVGILLKVDPSFLDHVDVDFGPDTVTPELLMVPENWRLIHERTKTMDREPLYLYL